MRKSIKIGDILFSTKKEALEYYKSILNTYNFGDVLNEEDFNDIVELIKIHPQAERIFSDGIKEIRISKLKYNTKCFEIVKLDNSTELFSYTKRINAPKTDFAKFREACRKAIQNDLRNVKLAYFEKKSKKGYVKCQETGELAKWEELSIDHRQPNTFSVIVDRFIEVNKIDILKIKYKKIEGEADEFADKELIKKFKSYHKEKANLRIVKKELNISRSFQARISRQKKDLTID